MGGAQTVVSGALLGIIGSIPSALLLELAMKKGRAIGVAAGLASIIISFALLVGALFVVRFVACDEVLPFGSAEAVSFLLVWAIEAWRAWRDANAPASPEEGKSGEPTR